MNRRGLCAALLAVIVAALGGGTLVATVSPDVVPWKPAGISGPKFESHAAFDPRTGDLYFVRSSPQFTGWRIMVSRCTDIGMVRPPAAGLRGDGVEADPWFTPMAAASTSSPRARLDGVKRKDLEIWRIDRDSAGAWGARRTCPSR